MRRTTAIAFAIVLPLLLAPILDNSVRAQPANGDWVVSGTQVIQNESITLNGNLTVQSGGNLTLRNVALSMNSQSDGQYGILVQPGGSLYVYGSTIGPAAKARRFSFVVDGSDFVMEDSQLLGAGWCSPGTTPNAAAQTCLWDDSLRPESGLLVETNNSLISENTFENNTIGLILAGSSEKVQGNQFGSNDLFSLGGYLSSYDTVTGNTFGQNPVYPLDDAVVYFHSGNNDTFSRNTFTINDAFIQSNSTLATGQWRLDGLKVDGSVGTVIADNVIESANNAVFLLQSHDSTVENNTVTFGEDGVSLLGPCVNTRILDNSLVSYPYHGGGGSYGVVVNLSPHSVIAGNSMSATFVGSEGGLQEGIYLDHSSNSSVVNNVMTSTQYGSFALVILLGSNNDLIAGNQLAQAEFGLILSSSDGNTLTGNNVSASYSATLEGSSSNVIYGNDFGDMQGSIGGPYDNGRNAWSVGATGNYWSYFSGQGQNGNGVGDSPYSRGAIPPNGTEPISSPAPQPVAKTPVPNPKPLSPPSGGKQVDIHSIVDQTFELDSGNLPGNLTIDGSTLLLAKTGPVAIGDGSGSLKIVNSKLLDLGYGFALGCRGATYCPISLVIVNSTVSGAFLNDLNMLNVTIVGSTITDSLGDQAVSVENAQTVQIVNSTFSGAISGLKSYCAAAAPVHILYSGDMISNIIQTGIGVCAGPRTVAIANNVVTACLGAGIEVSSDTLVQGNTIQGIRGYDSINVDGSNNTVVGNTISDTAQGGIGGGGSGNAIYGNNVTTTSGPVNLNAGGNLVYHNNFFISPNVQVGGSAGNQWNSKGEGNYWSSYSGGDADLDGIGDTPFVSGSVVDNYPFMRPNGWLTRFYLKVNTGLPVAAQFSINGSTFKLPPGGTTTLRLGYVAKYNISIPAAVPLGNGTSLVFSKWSDGGTSPTRLVSLSSNSTLSAAYVSTLTQGATTSSSTSTTITTATQSTTTSAATTSSTVSSATTTLSPTRLASATSTLTSQSLSTATSSGSPTGTGIVEFPYQVTIALFFEVLLVASYFAVKKRKSS